MCGIAGIISTKKIEEAATKMQNACNSLMHRGPDASNFFINETQTVALAHTRLSIIDLSNTANQPFYYLNYVAVYNGEIFNFKEVKNQLQQQNYLFTTQSDTEVLIAAYDCWGSQCLQKFDGMFAFVIYNKANETIFAARDAFGEKPFFYSIQNNQLLFSSEIQTLFTVGVQKNYNYTAWLNYIALGHTSNANDVSKSFYQNILQLPQGSFVECNVVDVVHLTPKIWFNFNESENDYSNNVYDNFNQIFTNAVSNKLIADVPLATSLSGGVDSSCIVACINNLHQKNNYSFKTFTARFNGFDKDESQYSKAICSKFNINQIFVEPTAKDLLNELPILLQHQQEPTQSASVLTQWMVYKTAAQQGIKVIIDGQGADELLGGYSKQMEWFLVFLKQQDKALFNSLKQSLANNEFIGNWGASLQLASFFPTYLQSIANLKNTVIAKKSNGLQKDFVHQHYNKTSVEKTNYHTFKEMLHYHTTTFGLPSLLRYADRNAMAFGLEVRLPFLSKQVAKFLFHLPNNYKVKDGFTKHILRNYLHENKLPEIAWRKGKIGYEPPQQQWMQTKAIQDMVKDAKLLLYNEKIITKQLMNAPIIASAAHSKNNIDWRLLNMGLILSLK